ncbi:uroporphyrinogen decarboxylase family protein [Chloroflexota bacterium]
MSAETDRKWTELTPEEKKAERFKRWLTPPDINFINPEAKQAYQERMQRLADVYQMKEPDRVPVQLPFGIMPAYYAGVDFKTVMYDYDELRRAWKKFLNDFEMDTYTGPGMVMPGRIYDLLDYKLYTWPGHGLPDDATGHQFVEAEYMGPDEYDALMLNPSDFWMRTYMPRIFGIFESFRHLQPFTNIIELPAGYFTPFYRPDIQATLQALIDIGKEFPKWQAAVSECTREAQEAGVPSPRGGGLTKAPFDTIGDTLRGTQGIIMDMYRQPEKLHEAMDVIANLTIDAAITSANASGGVTVGFPLHKGADGFMSAEQFETFYWPSLKKVCLALIEEGLIPSLFAEGSYLTRLETVNEFPKGAIMWRFDQTDMATAKKVLGDNCCISGNVPTSLLTTGTAHDVKEYCRKLIEDCAPGGGYILSSGASVDKAPPENMRAMMEAAREFGVYK